MRKTRFAAAALGTTLAVTGLTAAWSAPAHADGPACSAYLTTQGQNSTVRTTICESTALLAATVSPTFASSLCQVLMRLTGLNATTTQEACAQAVAP